MSTTELKKPPCGCKAIIAEEDPRAEIWMKVFGCLEFPLLSPMPVSLGNPSKRFLRGDLDALTPEQMCSLFEEMHKKFAVDRKWFATQNRALGYVPILDENITVAMCELHSRMVTA
jgi:hypothetical protein